MAEPQDTRWPTLRPVPRVDVLGVARTLTSATRLLDLMPLLRPEDVELYFTINPGSRFSEGLEEYLRRAGGTFLAWGEATRRPFDLAVAFTVHASMRQLNAPLMVLPHGVGYNRLVPESTGGMTEPVGLSRRELLGEDGRVIPATIGLTHDEQRRLLARGCPEAVPRAVLTGDLSHDRMRRSLPLRDRYRRALGVADGRRLVVINSTWGGHSLLGRCTDLPVRLVTELPADEFTVALVSHPNVWAWHTRPGVLRRLMRAVDAGLVVLPPFEEWRAAVLAADVVVGDHGSTTAYAAGLGVPVLLAATGAEELHPDSPLSAFGANAPRLDGGGELYGQIVAALERQGQERKALAGVTDRFAGVPGESAERVRETVYGYFRAKGVRPPKGQPARLEPLPDPVPDPVTGARAGRGATFDVEGWLGADGAVEMRRYPVVAGVEGRAPRDFFAVTADETDFLWRQAAEVMARTAAGGEVPATAWLGEQAARWPALVVGAAALSERRHLLRLPGGTELEAEPVRPWGAARPRLDALVLGAAVRVWLRQVAAPVDSLVAAGLSIRTGQCETRVRFTPRP